MWLLAVEVKNLSKTYKGAQGPIHAVCNMNLEIEQGSIFGLLGHNGAGKTTAFMVLNGLVSPTQGTATVVGYNVVKQRQKVKAQVGLLTEGLKLYDNLTVLETLHFFQGLYGQQKSPEPLLQRFGLWTWRHTLVHKLSTGMRKKLQIMASVIHQPQVLFLDEPFSGLDPMALADVRNFIQELQQDANLTVIVASHNLRELDDFCHAFGIMQRGRLIAHGTKAGLSEQVGGFGHVEVVVDGALFCPPLGVTVESNRLKIPLDPALLAKVFVRCEEQGVQILGVHQATFSLEDIYRHLYKGDKNHGF